MSSCSCPANNFFNLRPAASGLMYVYSLTLPVTQCFVRIIISYGGPIPQPLIFQSMRSSYSLLSNHSAGHLAILLQLLGKYFLVIRSVTCMWVFVFVKVHVLEGGVVPLLAHGVCSVCSFHVVLCHKAEVSVICCVTAVVLIGHDVCEWVSFLISILARFLAARRGCGFLVGFCAFLLWCR